MTAILDAIDRLADLPCLYARGDRPGTRVMICRQHRIIYTVIPDTGDNATAGDVLVLDIRGPGQL